MAKKGEKTAKELAQVASGDLRQQLIDSQQELFSIRFQLATGAQTNSSQIRTVKRRIARIHTVIREGEVGVKHIAKAKSNAATGTAKAEKAAKPAKAAKAPAAKAEKPAKAEGEKATKSAGKKAKS